MTAANGDTQLQNDSAAGSSLRAHGDAEADVCHERDVKRVLEALAAHHSAAVAEHTVFSWICPNGFIVPSSNRLASHHWPRVTGDKGDSAVIPSCAKSVHL